MVLVSPPMPAQKRWKSSRYNCHKDKKKEEGGRWGGGGRGHHKTGMVRELHARSPRNNATPPPLVILFDTQPLPRLYLCFNRGHFITHACTLLCKKTKLHHATPHVTRGHQQAERGQQQQQKNGSLRTDSPRPRPLNAAQYVRTLFSPQPTKKTFLASQKSDSSISLTSLLFIFLQMRHVPS